MKGGRSLPPNFQTEITSDMIEDSHLQDPNAPIFQGEQEVQHILTELGFEEGELEMFFDTVNGLVNEEQLIDRYLEIARAEPFNQNWQNENDAIESDYELNVMKPNGIAFTKHDIVNDVLNSFYSDITGGKKPKRSRRKIRKSKKQRKSKTKRHNKKTRRHRK